MSISIIAGALRAGWSDERIAKEFGPKHDYDVDAALKNGLSYGAIVRLLAQREGVTNLPERLAARDKHLATREMEERRLREKELRDNRLREEQQRL
jgi:hypothetical protein